MTPTKQKSPRVMGIVNVTRDSFSDGGKYLEPMEAIAHARRLVDAGAGILDIGPASSHPDAEHVAAGEEIRRISPVLDELRGAAELSVDSFLPETQRFALGRDVDYVNDIQGFPHVEMYEHLAAARCRLVVMHSVQRLGKATRIATAAEHIVDEVCSFFDERFEALEHAGIRRERFVLDPGMGFFLGSTPESSVAMLRAVPVLKARFEVPVLVSVSRKSFMGAITGRETGGRGAATLSAELFAALRGADIIRTHDVAALCDALAIWRALDDAS